jgi:undecaprenyl-diphosphatase
MKLGLLQNRYAEKEVRWMKQLQAAEVIPWLRHWAPVITQFGGTHCIIACTLLLFLMTRDDGMILFICALSHLVVHLLKRIFVRTRPYERSDELELRSAKMHDPSFPSGHTAAAWTLAMQVTLIWPLAGLLMVPMATLVGWSRIYLGVHFPGDVIVGMLIGVVIPLLLI